MYSGPWSVIESREPKRGMQRRAYAASSSLGGALALNEKGATSAAPPWAEALKARDACTGGVGCRWKAAAASTSIEAM